MYTLYTLYTLDIYTLYALYTQGKRENSKRHKGKGKRSQGIREKGKGGSLVLESNSIRQPLRAHAGTHARTKRNEAISRLDSPPTVRSRRNSDMRVLAVPDYMIKLISVLRPLFFSFCNLMCSLFLHVWCSVVSLDATGPTGERTGPGSNLRPLPGHIASDLVCLKVAMNKC